MKTHAKRLTHLISVTLCVITSVAMGAEANRIFDAIAEGKGKEVKAILASDPDTINVANKLGLNLW